MTSIIEAVRKEVEHLNREIAKAVERPAGRC